MWKRLNNQRRAVTSPIQSPLHGNPYEASGGLGINISPPISPPGQNQPPPRPARHEDGHKGLPRLPFEAVEPLDKDSKFTPASSVYPHGSLNPTQHRNHRVSMATPSTTYTEEVSPPSSPEFEAYARQSQGQYIHDGEVSPIDETPEISRLYISNPDGKSGSNPRQQSNIPVLRREKRRNQAPTAATDVISRKNVGETPKVRRVADVRWDPYSGEQTNSEKGKPQSVKPGEFTLPGLRSVSHDVAPPRENKSSANAKPRPSFGERVRNLTVNTTSVEKPEWRGASGRHTLVSPVSDNLEIAPLNVPRKSSKRVTSPRSGRSGSSTPVSVIRSQLGDETSHASAQPIGSDRRSAPDNDGPRSPLSLDVATPRNISPPSPALADATLPLDPANTHLRRASVESAERKFRDGLQDVNFHPNGTSSDPYTQPPSRFSVTTYAPSEPQSTPRPSTDDWDIPPVPTPPAQYTSDAQQPPLTVTRQRPPPITSPKATARKAIPPLSPVFIKMSTPSARGAPSPRRATNAGISNTAKSLPLTPAEVSASGSSSSQDLITSLQAQLDSLAHRRQNITRSIVQMTQLMPTDGLLVSEQVRRKREVEKVKVEKLRAEEADLKWAEHELGLKLLRAWRRRDEEEVYEGVWGRRRVSG